MNNERESKNATYKEVLAGLENLVLVMWDDDTTIIPKVVVLQIKFASFKLIEGLRLGFSATPIKSVHTHDKVNLKESAHFGFYALEQDTEVTIF